MGRQGHVDEFAHFANAIIENGYINGVHLRIDGAAKFSHMWLFCKKFLTKIKKLLKLMKKNWFMIFSF